PLALTITVVWHQSAIAAEDCLPGLDPECTASAPRLPGRPRSEPPQQEKETPEKPMIADNPAPAPSSPRFVLEVCNRSWRAGAVVVGVRAAEAPGAWFLKG